MSTTSDFKIPCDHKGALSQYFTEGETDFAHCSNCGLVLRHPMPTEKALDAIYADLYRSDNINRGITDQESGRYALEQYAKFLNAYMVAPGAYLLDYGCGSGELVKQLRVYGVDAIGLERSDDARQFAFLKRGLDLLRDINDIPKDSLSIVTMIEVIEHLPSPYSALLDIRRRLKPGGRIFITTPNRRGFRARLEGGRWREAQKNFHVALFDRESLTNLLSEAGYMKIKKIFFPPVQRPGIIGWLVTRLLQLCGIPGTLCMTAHAPR